MQGPFVLLEIGGAESITGGHVIALEDLGGKLWRRLGRVGVVPVNQHIDIRINLLEHGSDDMTLPLLCRGSWQTMAFRCLAMEAVASVELLSKTYRSAVGKA